MRNTWTMDFLDNKNNVNRIANGGKFLPNNILIIEKVQDKKHASRNGYFSFQYAHG